MKTLYTDLSSDLRGMGMTQIVRAMKGDTCRTLRVRLRDGGEPYEIAPDCYAVLMGKKPDGTVLYNSCQIIDNVIAYPFTEQTCSSVGSFQVQVRLYGPGEKHITTVPVQLEVYPTAFDAEEAARSGDEQTALDDLVNRTRELQLDILHGKQSGAFDGESAYEIAKRLGFTGSETEWVESLRYDHSEEFQRLADQVREYVRSAAESAEKAAKAALDAKAIIDDTSISHQKTYSSQKIAETIEKARKEAINSCAPSFEKTGPIVLGHLVPAYPMEIISCVSSTQIGVDEIKMVKCGDNLVENPLGIFSRNGIRIDSKSDGTVHISGTATAAVFFDLTIPDFLYEKMKGINVDAMGTEKRVNGFDFKDIVFRSVDEFDPACFIRVPEGPVDTVFCPMISMDGNHDFAAYSGRTYTQILPEKVFGGTYNWRSGELISTLDASGAELPTPKKFQLMPETNLFSQNGVTTVYSNAGDTRVIARADPSHLFSSLQSDIAALQDMILKQ